MNNTKLNIQDTLLQSGKPILIKELNLLIYQPKLIEFILNGGEEAIQYFLKIISLEPSIEDLQNFPGIKELDIIYAITNKKENIKLKEIFDSFMLLFFKDFNIQFEIKKEHAVLVFKNKNINTMPPIMINNLDFLILKKYIEVILNIDSSENKESFNPDSEKAKEIKAKLDRGKALRDKIRNKNHTFLFNAISSFAIEQKMSIEYITDNFTLYQFYIQYLRMNSKINHDNGLRAMLAGAKDVKLPDWQGSI